MHTQAQNFGLRFAVVLCCAVVAVELYFRAEVKAIAYHAYYRHFIHPWESTALTVIILALCATSCVMAVPVLRHGSIMQRIAVAFVVLFPIFIVGRFLFWVAHQWSVR